MSGKNLVRAAEEALGGISIRHHGGRYTAWYLAEETGEAYWLTAADLRYALACREAHGGDAYSHWCAGSGVPMSARARREVSGE